MYGNQPMKIEEICYEDGTIKQVFDNRDVYLIYPDESLPTGRIEKQEPLSEEEFEKLVKSIENDFRDFKKKFNEKTDINLRNKKKEG